jgi:hypothetical protein
VIIFSVCLLNFIARSWILHIMHRLTRYILA